MLIFMTKVLICKNIQVRSEVTMKHSFWDVASYNLVEIIKHCRRICCVHLNSKRLSRCWTMQLCKFNTKASRCGVWKPVMICWSYNITRKELLTQKNYSTLNRKCFTLSVLQLSNVGITDLWNRWTVTRERVQLLD